MSGPPQDFCVFASENPRIGRSVAKEHDLEPIRWQTAYDLFHGQVLRVRAGFIRERWGEYRKHEDPCATPLVSSLWFPDASAVRGVNCRFKHSTLPHEQCGTNLPV